MAKNVIEIIARGKDLVTPEFTKMAKSMKKLKKSVFSLQTAFVTLGGVFAAKKIKDLALFTANVDLLRLSMHQLAKVNNINAKFLDANVEIMKSMGVATDDAMRSLNSFIRLNLDLTKATKFTRIAQDLAVISQRTTSEVIEQLTRGVTTLNARVLRNAGIFFTAQQASKEWAKENNRTVASMSTAEKQSAVMNKILKEAPKFIGAYEASLSSAGKKVLQLNRLWKEAKLAVGGFTQDALMLGVESIQDFLKSIVTLRNTGRLDEFGKELSNTLLTVIRVVKNLFNSLVSLTKTLYEYRIAILAVIVAIKGFSIIRGTIAMIKSLNLAITALTGDAIVPFFVSIQRLTTEIGLFQSMAISLSTTLGILGTAFAGLGIGFFLGDLISTSNVMRDLRDTIMESNLSQEVKKFFDEWVFGALKVEDLQKQITENLKEQAELQVRIRLKKAKKVQEELANEERSRRRQQENMEKYGRISNQIYTFEEQSLSKTERKLNVLISLRGKLQAVIEARKVDVEQLGGEFDEEAAKKKLGRIAKLEQEFREELAEEKRDARLKELQEVSEHGDSLAKVMSARLELFVQNAKSSWALFADTVMQIGGLMKSAVDDSIFTLLTGVGSIEQIWTSLWQSMLKSVISAVTGMIAQMVLLKIAALLGIGSQLVAETASNAVEVYGNTFASAAAVPGIGWLYAPIAASENLTTYLAGVPIAFAAGTGAGAGLVTLAQGGIVDSPTLSLIGEAGPEAVIPLSGPEAERRLGGRGVSINNLTLELFPNITDGSFLFNVPRTKLEQWTRKELLPVFDSLNERNIRPQRG